MKDNYDISPLQGTKKRKNSRAKGNTFERSIATTLNNRFNTTEFSRSPGSGAFATTHSLPEYLKIYGDLITPKDFKFCIECKKGYNKENIYSLYNNRSDFWKFIRQAQKDADKCHKEPLLIFKQDRQQILAVIPYHINIYNTQKYIQIEDTEKKHVYKIYLFNELLKEPDHVWYS